MFKKFPKPIIYTLAVILLLLVCTQTALGKRILLENTVVKAIREFLSSPAGQNLSACDYQDGEILLVKPIATGVGDGRYEAGDIVEIRNGTELCNRFGNSNFLGDEERTTLLPLYYRGQLSEEQKQELLKPEYEPVIRNSQLVTDDKTTSSTPLKSEAKMLKRRQSGIDYAQILSDREIIKARSQEKIDRIPEVDLGNIIDKKNGLSLKTGQELSSDASELSSCSSSFCHSGSRRLSGIQGKAIQFFKYLQTIRSVRTALSWIPARFAAGMTKENRMAEKKSVVNLPRTIVYYENTRNILKQIAKTIISPVIAQSSPTEVTKTVDTGGYADYTSLNAWEAGQQTDLTSTNEIRIAKCQTKTATSTADTVAVTIDGWTTSATQYIKIWTDPAESYRHAGVWNAAKYNLINSATATFALQINESEVYIDGLQLSSAPLTGGYGTIDLGSSSGNIWISNCIIKQYGSPTTGYNAGIKVYLSGSGTLYVWNTIIYNYSASNNEGIEVDDSDYTCYFYNLTIHNCFQGIAQWNGTVYALNCLTQSCGDGFYGSFTSSNYNLSDIAGDAPGANSRNGPVDGAVIFADEVADDFHLASNDAGALGYAISSVDSLFTDDIDGQARPYGLGASSTKWDIGADEFKPTEIYRSVGPSNTTALTAGYTAGATMSISGNNATFSTSLPDNVGVGDVIIYTSTQGTSDTATNSVAFIHGRTDSTHYTVKDVAGKMASSTYQATTKWAIYRAYTSLANAESGDENDGLPDSLETFESWTGGKNLASSTEQWNIAAYADAADTTAVTIDGWTTTADNYIKIYTPYLTSEVGTSQRHNGKWDTGKYRLEVGPGQQDQVILVKESYTRVDGLQLKQSATEGYTADGLSMTETSLTDIRVSNNIIWYNGSNNVGMRGILYAYTDYPKVWNNIIYGGFTSCLEGANLAFGIYNNTVSGCAVGIGVGGGGHADQYVINNLVYNCANPYSGYADTFKNNATDRNSTMSYGTGSGNRINQSFAFVNAANNNFHLSPSDTSARDQGVNLTNDPDLSFSTDIDGETRCAQCATGGWDIGADEARSATEINTTRGLPASLSSGLVGYWSFNGADLDWASTTAEALDRSNYSNNGDVINMSPSSVASGISGQALKFDGVDDYVYRPDGGSLDISGDEFTISLWFKANSLPPFGQQRQLVWKDDVSANAYALSLSNGDDAGTQLRVEAYNTTPTGYVRVSTIAESFSTGAWYHVVGVLPGAGSYLLTYINGVDKSQWYSGVFSGTLKNGTGGLDIGSAYGFTGWFDGLIDEVRIYDRALSASEIQQLYKSGAAVMNINTPITQAGAQSGLVGSWTFNGPDVALPDNNEANRVFDEKFEGTGYEESGWSETIGSGATVDEDAASSEAGSSPGWGSQSLKIDTNTTETYARRDFTEIGTVYFRAELYFASHTIPAGSNDVFIVWNSADWNWPLQVAFYNKTGVGLIFVFKIDGGWVETPSVISLNTRYRFEIYYSAAGGWEARLDGVTIASGGSTLYNGLAHLWLGVYAGAPSGRYVAYFDNIAIDTATWVGTEGYVTDTSGQANHGDPAGMTKSSAVSGLSGQALKFDGVNDYVDVGTTNIPETSPYTATAWFNGNNLGVSWKSLVEKWDDTGNKFAFQMFANVNNIGCYGRNSNNDIYYASTSQGVETNNDKWIFVACVMGSGTIEAYRFGVASSENEAGTYQGWSVSSTGAKTTIGAKWTSGAASDLFPGLIDEVRVYNRALSASEIQQLYMLGTGRQVQIKQ